MPWALCPWHTAPQPNCEASVVISMPGLSMASHPPRKIIDRFRGKCHSSCIVAIILLEG